MAGQFLHKAVCVVIGQQYLGRACRQQHRLVQLWVQGLEVLQGQACQTRHEVHIHVALNVDREKEGVIFQGGQHQAETAGGRNDVLHGLQFGHVVACLVGHPQGRVDGVFARLAVALQSALNVALPPVVGGQRQMPIAKLLMQHLQVIQGRARGGQNVAPVVPEQVLLQLELAARSGHELPHARCAGHRERLRIEGALDEGQEGQLHGQPTLVHLLHHVEEIAPASLSHALHVVRAGGVPLLPFAYQVRIQAGHGEAATHPFPEIGPVSRAVLFRPGQGAQGDGVRCGGTGGFCRWAGQRVRERSCPHTGRRGIGRRPHRRNCTHGT